MNVLKNPIIEKNTILIIGDIIISFLSFYAGFTIRYYYDVSLKLSQYPSLLPRAITFSIIIVLMCFLMELYGVKGGENRKEIFLKILFAGVFTTILLAALYYFVPPLRLIRGVLFIAICISVTMQFIWHIVYDFMLKMPGVTKKVLILGTGPIAKTMGKLCETAKNNLVLSGYINCVNEPINVPRKDIIGNGDSLLSIALKERAQKIVVSLSERRETLPVKEVLDCKMKGIDIVDGPSFYEQMTGKLFVENISPSWFIFSEGFKATIFRKHFKRVFDVILSVIGLILSLPFMLIIPVLIKFDSKGPILLRQKRLGEGERVFTLYKFRTMIDNAEKDAGPVWSQENDNRITRVGRILRKSRLDEIPQLFNILQGDMSFIGPRPERPFFIESLKKQIPYYSERHCIKPGLTGWAQVRFEYGDSIEDTLEKLRYDLYYIKHLSFSLDLLILLDTVRVILFGRGGR